MLCLISDIKTKIPTTGRISSRCLDYAIEGNDGEAEIVIDESLYDANRWKNASVDTVAYMESARQFYYQLPNFNGMMLHASATVINGETYLFAGQSGIGKSTHANLLLKNFPGAQLINDDKPALRHVDGKWMAYGTPWCGKDGININAKSPLKAVCLLTARRDRNHIELADSLKAVTGIISCSAGRGNREVFIKISALIDKLVKDVPIYEMDSLANDESALMAYNAMKNGI